jgi:transposase-like protein
MPERRRKYTSEFRDEAAKMVIETVRPIAEIAREIHVNEGTLGNWARQYRACGVPELGHQCCPGLLGGCFVFVDQAAEDGSARDPFR